MLSKYVMSKLDLQPQFILRNARHSLQQEYAGCLVWHVAHQNSMIAEGLAVPCKELPSSSTSSQPNIVTIK